MKTKTTFAALVAILTLIGGALFAVSSSATQTGDDCGDYSSAQTYGGGCCVSYDESVAQSYKPPPCPTTTSTTEAPTTTTTEAPTTTTTEPTTTVPPTTVPPEVIPPVVQVATPVPATPLVTG